MKKETFYAIYDPTYKHFYRQWNVPVCFETRAQASGYVSMLINSGWAEKPKIIKVKITAI